MRPLIPYIRPYKKEIIIAPAFKLLEVLFELLVPLVVAGIIDTGIAGGDTAYIRRRCLLLVALALVGFSCTLVAQFFAARAAAGFAGRLRSALFAHIQTFAYADLDDLGTSTLITRMTSDVQQIQTGLNLALRLLMRSPVVVFGAMIMAFTVDVRAALIFAVLIPVLLGAVFLLMGLSIPRFARVQQKLDRLTLRTRETLTGVRVLRAFGQEAQERQTFQEDNAAYTALQRGVGRISALLNPLTFVILNLGVAWLIRTGALRVSLGDLTQGQVVALYNYMSQILVELIKLANLIITINKALACSRRVSAVLTRPASMPDGRTEAAEAVTGPAAVPEEAAAGQAASSEEAVTGQASAPEEAAADRGAGTVEFRDVDLTYTPGADAALTGISLTARPGETVGIIGGTGAGKTSLVQLIPRFYDVTGGQVLVGGRDVRAWDPEELRSRIGVVPQQAVLFRGTLRDNLRWGREDATEEEILEAVRLAQASDVVASRPEGLDAPVEQGGRNFSGGQRQRLCIARALVRRPEILILDDSSSALDMATDAALREAIASLEGKMTTFIVSQRTAPLQRADRILVLEDGRAVGLGTHEQLLADCPVYREIFSLQQGKEAADEA